LPPDSLARIPQLAGVDRVAALTAKKQFEISATPCGRPRRK
jgi:hypothetical protein